MTEPRMTQKFPYVVEETARRVAWCQCGLSASQPYCDGLHKGTGFRPVIIELTEDKTVAWCGCRRSKKGAYCDGSHKEL